MVVLAAKEQDDMASSQNRSGTSFRKAMVQVGVVLFLLQMSQFIYIPSAYSLPGDDVLVLNLVLSMGVAFLFVAALLSSRGQDSWGSIWPLIGRDVAIDGIYTRGQWHVRYQETDEQDRARSVTTGMISLHEE